MRRLLFLSVLAATVSSGPAFAEVHMLSGTYTFSQVLDTCTKSGGVSSSDGEGYACTMKNCDGKGGTCTVSCGNDGKCAGSTPDSLRGGRGRTLGSLLGANTLKLGQPDPTGAQGD